MDGFLKFLGLINIIFIVSSFLVLILSGKKLDLRQATLSNYGTHPETKKFFNFALVGFGMSHVVFFSLVANKLGILSNSALLLALVATLLCPVLTAITTLNRHYLIHTVSATSGIFFISLAAFILSLTLARTSSILGVIGMSLPLLIIFGSLWGVKKNYCLGGMIEFFFVTALIFWNVIFTLTIV